jgi:hypothetical protein
MHELDPVECHMLGMSIDRIVKFDLTEFKKHDGGDGMETKPNTSRIPDFVINRTTKIVPIDDTEVE